MLEHGYPEGERGCDEHTAQYELPLASRVLELAEGLAEGGPVERLLLLTAELLPVAFFLLTESLD